MCTKLGARLTAFLVDKDVSTVNRWKNGKATPDPKATTLLREAYQVFQMLEPSDSDATIRAWFLGMNPQLDDLSPIEALREGQRREVMAAARAWLAGG